MTILLKQARGYLMMAKSLKSKDIPSWKMYLNLAKDCVKLHQERYSNIVKINSLKEDYTVIYSETETINFDMAV